MCCNRLQQGLGACGTSELPAILLWLTDMHSTVTEPPPRGRWPHRTSVCSMREGACLKDCELLQMCRLARYCCHFPVSFRLQPCAVHQLVLQTLDACKSLSKLLPYFCLLIELTPQNVIRPQRWYEKTQRSIEKGDIGLDFAQIALHHEYVYLLPCHCIICMQDDV